MESTLQDAHSTLKSIENRREKRKRRWKKDLNLKRKQNWRKKNQFKRSNLRSSLKLNLKLRKSQKEEFSKSQLWEDKQKSCKFRKRQMREWLRTQNTWHKFYKIQLLSKIVTILPKNIPLCPKKTSSACTSRKCIEPLNLIWFASIWTFYFRTYFINEKIKYEKIKLYILMDQE